MNSKDLARFLVLGGVLAGLTAGTELRANTRQTSDNTMSAATQISTDKKAAEKHACKGLNGCKGEGADGKNECKGKGSCASKEYRHACSGKNACKGQGQGGKNECKGKSACSVPPAAS